MVARLIAVGAAAKAAAKKAKAKAPAAVKKRWRKCSLCKMSLERNGLRQHYKQCCSVVAEETEEEKEKEKEKGKLGTVFLKGSFQECDVVLAALDPALGRQLRGFSEEVVRQYSRCKNKGTRTAQEGRLYGLGWSKRWQSAFGPRDPKAQDLQGEADKLLAKALSPETLFGSVLQGLSLPWDKRLPTAGVGKAEGCCCFVGVNYSPVVKAADRAMAQKQHGFPDPLLRSLWPRPLLHSRCQEKCRMCKTQGCIKCESCPLHYDNKDTSSTVLLLWQPRDTPAAQSARWLIAGQAFPVNQGIGCLFNGKCSSHGVWIPAEHEKEKYPIYGIAFVNR